MSAPPLVTMLRARPQVLRLAPAGAPVLTIRAQLAEAWDTLRIEAGRDEMVAAVKARALDTFGVDSGLPDEYMVKLSGVEILDEDVSLQAAGVVDGSTLFIAYRRRRPVR
jgi:hypothetical protein